MKVSLVEDVLRDPLFVSNVILRGRLDGRIEARCNELRIGGKLTVGTGLKLVSGYITVGGRNVSIRALVLDGEILALLTEPSEVDVRNLSSYSVLLTVYEVPRELVEVYPQLKELIGGIEESQKLSTVRNAPSIQTIGGETFVGQDVAPVIERMLDNCNLSVEYVSVVSERSKIVVNVVARNRLKKFVDHDIATYVMVAALAKALRQRFALVEIEIALELDGKRRVATLRNEESRWRAFSSGIASYVAMKHGFRVNKVSTSIDMSRKSIDVVMNLKSLHERATPEVLQQIAFESVREIKMLWMGRVCIRAKSGRFTEGRAEA